MIDLRGGFETYKEYTVDVEESDSVYNWRILYGDDVVATSDVPFDTYSDAKADGLYQLRRKLYRGELDANRIPEVDKHYRSPA